MAKRYGVTLDGGRVASVEVDGVSYARVEDVPDPIDREQVRRLVAAQAPGAPAAAPIPVERVVAGVFAAVSAVLLLAAALTGVATARSLAREVRTEGRVVDLTARTVEVPRDADDPDRHRGGVTREFFYPVIEFALPDGTTKTVQTADGSWPPAYEKGQAVTVLYDRDNPLDARVASGTGTLLRWAWTLITGVLGLAFAAATALIYRPFIRK